MASRAASSTKVPRIWIKYFYLLLLTCTYFEPLFLKYKHEQDRRRGNICGFWHTTGKIHTTIYYKKWKNKGG